jgi:hypothetical protein
MFVDRGFRGDTHKRGEFVNRPDHDERLAKDRTEVIDQCIDIAGLFLRVAIGHRFPRLISRTDELIENLAAVLGDIRRTLLTPECPLAQQRGTSNRLSPVSSAVNPRLYRTWSMAESFECVTNVVDLAAEN